jgi:hypothetical protein
MIDPTPHDHASLLPAAIIDLLQRTGIYLPIALQETLSTQLHQTAQAFNDLLTDKAPPSITLLWWSNDNAYEPRTYLLGAYASPRDARDAILTWKERIEKEPFYHNPGKFSFLDLLVGVSLGRPFDTFTAERDTAWE